MASPLLWRSTNGLGLCGSPADRRHGSSHGHGLAPGEPAGRLPAVPLPGLAGLRGRAQLPRVAGQPGPQERPAALGMRTPRPPRTAAAAGQALLGSHSHRPPVCSQPRG